MSESYIYRGESRNFIVSVQKKDDTGLTLFNGLSEALDVVVQFCDVENNVIILKTMVGGSVFLNAPKFGSITFNLSEDETQNLLIDRQNVELRLKILYNTSNGSSFLRFGGSYNYKTFYLKGGG